MQKARSTFLGERSPYNLTHNDLSEIAAILTSDTRGQNGGVALVCLRVFRIQKKTKECAAFGKYSIRLNDYSQNAELLSFLLNNLCEAGLENRPIHVSTYVSHVKGIVPRLPDSYS